jgi:hypothetical protein
VFGLVSSAQAGIGLGFEARGLPPHLHKLLP